MIAVIEARAARNSGRGTRARGLGGIPAPSIATNLVRLEWGLHVKDG